MKKKEIKSIQIGKEKVKLFLFTDKIIFYMENPKGSIKVKKVSRSNDFKGSRYKVKIQTSFVFLK